MLIPILSLLSLPPTSALDRGWTLLNLTHTPTLPGPSPPPRNGSITFTLAPGTAHSAHACSRAFAAPDTPAAGGPVACSDDWPDLLYYWRERDAGAVELDVWFAYLDCTPNGGAVSESGKVELPAGSGTEGEEEDGIRAWGSVFVPAQAASSTAWYPGQYEEVCLRQGGKKIKRW